MTDLNLHPTNKKILVAGDVLGQFTKFYQRLKNVEARAGPFDMVLCVGSFFSIEDEESEDPNLKYIAKEFKDEVKIPIYVLGPVYDSQVKFYKPLFVDNLVAEPSFEAGYDIATGVTYLGKKGILTAVDDLKIAYISGRESEKNTNSTFNQTLIDELIKECSSTRIDILLTSDYPALINENSFGGKSDYLKKIIDTGSLLISKLAKGILPRYHFSASSKQFYEREPYRNHNQLVEQPKLVTRFISIASVGNGIKDSNNKEEKWLYAFNIIPSKHLSKDELNKQPDEATENPYSNINFDSMISNNNQSTGFNNGAYFFDNSDNRRGGRQQFNNRNQQYRSNNNRPNNYNNNNGGGRSSSHDDEEDKRFCNNETSCWFCLSSPQVEKYLIICIGEYSYLALAKGGLIDHHFLICPISHIRSINEIENNPDLENLAMEMGKFKNAIVDYFFSQDKVPVFFERNFKSGHLQLQAVAIPKDKIHHLYDVLNNESSRNQFTLYEISNGNSLASQIGEKVPYFYIEFNGSRFFIGIKPNRGFPMQFGRELLVHERLLNCPAKVDWRYCEKDKNNVIKIVEKIRKEFEPFDFTD